MIACCGIGERRDALGWACREAIRKALPRAGRTLLVMLCVAAWMASRPAAAGTYSVLYQFGPPPSGSYGPSSIVGLPSRSLVGLAANYSDNNSVNVFKLDPPGVGQTAWTYSVIYDSRSYPVAGQLFAPSLLVDASGNLYGSTTIGDDRLGTGKSGTVFRLSPPLSGSGTWTCTVLFQNYNSNGTNMSPDILTYLDPTARHLYGLGFFYQPIGLGGKPVGLKIFRLDLSGPGAPPASTLTPISSPIEQHDQLLALTYSREGAFYGAAYNPYRSPPTDVFRLAPPAPDTGQRQLQTLASSLPNGDQPYQSVVVDLEDRITGVGYNTANYGEIWRLSPPSVAGGAWQSSVLYTFKGPSAQDGSGPLQIVSRAGLFFGITQDGGRSSAGKLARSGTLFELSSPPAGSTAEEWNEQVLHTFGDPSDGSNPGSLTAVTQADGTYALFGAAAGGINGSGMIFRYVP